MKKLIAAGALVLTVAACDTGARKDLSDENQNLDEGTADVALFPHRFPNVAHKCVGEPATTGIWTNTDRAVWIFYNDPRCGGDGSGPILDNIPGGSPATEEAGSG